MLRYQCGSPPNAHVAEMWDTAAEAVMLLLSPESVPRRSGREAWESLLQHLEMNQSPPVASILVDSCEHPKLVERRRFYRWSEGPLAVLRNLERWVVGMQAVESRSFDPARVPGFEGDVEDLWTRLVDEPGTVRLASGQWALAQEFARQAAEHFRDIVWWTPGDPVPEVEPLHRVLLIAEGGEFPLPDDRRASVLLLAPHPCEVAPAGDAAERALSACAGPLVPLDLLARVAGVDGRAGLIASGYAAAADATGRRLRPLRRAPVEVDAAIRHADVIADAFTEWRPAPEVCRAWMGEWPRAFETAVARDWALALRLAWTAGSFLRAQGRDREAAVLYDQLERAASLRRDSAVVEQCRTELFWLRGETGELRSPIRAGAQLGLNFDTAAS